MIRAPRRVLPLTHIFYCHLGALLFCVSTLTVRAAETNRVVTVRHAPSINSGLIEGSLQQLTGESVSLNGGLKITGNLYVPGTPTVLVSGNPNFGGVFTASGAI